MKRQKKTLVPDRCSMEKQRLFFVCLLFFRENIKLKTKNIMLYYEKS